MNLFFYITFACAVLVVKCKNLPENSTAVISTYAKVAHWGASSSANTETPQTEGRSHHGQSLWTHRSDAKVVGGQNLKSKPGIVYHYAIKASPKTGIEKSENTPGVGEIQERFNPRPYFDYAQVPSKYDPSPPKAEKNPSGPSPTFDSFPVFNQPPSSPPQATKPSLDLYTSPYTSYNPPNPAPDAPPSDSDAAYPPNAPPPPDNDPMPEDSDEGYQYNAPQNNKETPHGPPKPSYASFGPPLAPPDDEQDQPLHPPEQPESDDGQPDFPQHFPSKDQLFYPPSENGHHPEVILDHPPPGYEEEKPDLVPHMGGMMPIKGKGPPGKDMGEQDLSPPPGPDGGHFPQYLYTDPNGQHDFGSFYDHDHHHVYKEITTEAPEDKRVSGGHYSYYYLGRKLWYIPLYFSIYFILYVTVLILKSIARHKVQLKHEHFHHKKREHRQMDLERIDDLHANVDRAINKRKIGYIAM